MVSNRRDVPPVLFWGAQHRPQGKRDRKSRDRHADKEIRRILPAEALHEGGERGRADQLPEIAAVHDEANGDREQSCAWRNARRGGEQRSRNEARECERHRGHDRDGEHR